MKPIPASRWFSFACQRKGRLRLNMLLEPKATNSCFGCGAANPRGMMLTFEQDDTARCIRGEFSLSADYQGGGGFIHGGIIALVLDEAMGKVNRFRELRAVTAELTIEYLKPVPVGEDLVIEAREVEKNGRNLHHVGEIRNRAGVVLARGRGRFVDISSQRGASS
jgi:uncharacterized protein (TIGR00369 family)